MAKYIFVTGGVVSSLGKGIAAASIGCLLESRGLKVTLQKFDPYLNVDPGTMSPFQHGEVFVTDDGAETDLDLGHYERFTHSPLSQANNLTSEFDRSRGWDENLRDIRVDALCDIACNHARLATHVYLKHDDFNKYIASLLLPYRQLSSDNPYPLMVMQLVFLLANFQATVSKESEEIDIFLDTQLGFETELMVWWNLFLDYEDLDGLPLADFVSAPPAFGNSKKLLQLQAADMFVWHRRYCYATGVKTSILARLEDRPTLRCPIGEKPLKAIGEVLKRQLKAFQIIMPDAPLFPAGKKGRRFTRKLRREN